MTSRTSVATKPILTEGEMLINAHEAISEQRIKEL